LACGAAWTYDDGVSIADFARVAEGRKGSRVPALERLQGGEEVRFLAGSRGPSYLRTDLDVCTDGSGPSHGDKWHQDQTAGAYADGTYLNADVTPYLVLPPQGYKALGASHARVGDVCVLRYQDRWTPALLAEVGPKSKIGEASYVALQELTGLTEVNPNTGAIPSGVECLVFPGSGRGQSWTLANSTPEALRPQATELLQRQLATEDEPGGCWGWLA